MSDTKPPIVLVHGAWHGAWCWRRVVPLLRAAGYEVYAPTLTGLADKAHLLSRSVNLATHVDDVLGLIEAEELRDAVLVGHSYAGMVITGVADRVPERLRSLVYLDAFVPESDKRLIDYAAADRREAMIKAGQASGFVDPPPATLFGLKPGTPDMDWVTRRMTKQPLRTMADSLTLRNGGGAQLQRSYIYCANPPTGSFQQFAAVLREDRRWRFHEFNTGHDCMVTEPAETARLILAGV